MTEAKVYRLAGLFGLGAVFLVLCELPLWVFPGSPPPINDADAYSRYLAGIRIVALSRVLIDMGIYACLMVFFAGFRHLIVKTNASYEWLATLVFGAGVVWWAVLLVANALQGGAVLHTVGGNIDPTAVRTLVEGTLLIFNGPVAFAASGLFMASAGHAILATRALPKLTGYLAWAFAALCVAAMPAVLVNEVDFHRFYNAAGWGPGVVAALTPIAWFTLTGLAMLRVSARDSGDAD